MIADDIEVRFGILREIFRLSQEQRLALEADDIDLFERQLAEREGLLEQLVALDDETELPANVVRFRSPTASERTDGETAIRALIQGILDQDAKNEEIIRARIGEVQDAMHEIGRGSRAARGYRQRLGDSRAVDRAV